MTVSSSAKADANLTPRLKSAVLWGVVGALFFLVLHQAYLLVDGQFLGVGPVAAVAVGVFTATVVASYFTAGHLDVFEPDETTVETADATAPGPVTAPDAESESATEPEPATETTSVSEQEATEPVADESVSDDAEDDETDDETTDGEPDDDAEDEWIWGGQDG